MALIVLLATVPSCAKPSNDWRKMSRAEKASLLRRITAECKLSSSSLELQKQDEVRFMPDVQSTYTSVDCALSKLKSIVGFGKIGFVGNEKIGFVGDEAYTDEGR